MSGSTGNTSDWLLAAVKKNRKGFCCSPLARFFS